jgi:tetratricopeptide (TPR) repeat protein
LVYTRLGEYQLALQEFERALALARSNRLVIAWDTGGYGLSYRAMVLCNRAGTWMRMGDHARALEDCDQAIAVAPRYGYAHAQRGIACLWLSDLEGARVAFVSGQAANHGFALNGLLLNWLDLSSGARAEEVAACLERVAATADAYLPAAPVCTGAARCLRKDYERALPELERALAWEPDGWTAPFWLGMVRAASGQEDELALAAIRRALELGMPPVLAGPLERARPGFLPH